VLLAHPGTQVVSASSQPNEARLLNLRDVSNPVTLVYERHLPPTALAAGKGGDHFESFRFRHGGVDYLASATAFRVDEGLTWIVGALAPEDDFLGGVRRGQRIALGVAGGAVLGALGLAVLLSRRVSSPVVNLIGFMRRVSEGDLESKAALRGPHEFRQLSANLNRMIDDLRDRMKLRHSLHLAMEVQQRLLPSAPPKVPGLDLAGHSTYCDETGGDYYDFLVIDQTHPTSVVIALGDVMGHGIAAALVMAGARAVLRDRATTTGSLAHVLDRINKLLNEDMQGTKFMTLHLSIIDAAARTFRWASAGHDPAIIFDPAEGKFHEIDESGFPLGVNDDGMYSEHTFVLKPGQIITIGTDGIWEMADDRDEQFGKERLREIIRASANQSAGEISKIITDALSRFRGHREALDDVTFVVAKVI
jgi:sigma-B regulation protein RsbU (phosphoserine phosphatase)